ncbi:MAG TPA: hypothetical protein VH000_08575 [Rhizomicrobium sp.]|nr:hypothetical protein [Rhizomicrobium sp.]
MSTTIFSEHAAASEHADGIALWRLYLLRGGYLLIAIGMGSIMVPAFLQHGPWALDQGLKNAMLLALSVLCVLGLRYPLKMLPVLFFEMAWKGFWLGFIALPAWRNGTLDADMRDTVFSVSFVAIYLALIPWDYVWCNYVTARGDRLR